MQVAKLVLRVCLGVALTCGFDEVEAAEPDTPEPPLTDLYGDPLPTHAILRLGTTRFHHQSFIEDAAFSPDGRMLASAAANQDVGIALWEIPSGRLLRRFTAPARDKFRPWNNALAFSPDGKKLLTADNRGRVHLWNVAGGDELYAIDAHAQSHGATAVAFSADGQWFASGGGDGVVRVWNTDRGHELLSFDTLPQGAQFRANAYRGIFPTGSIAALAFSPDGKHLAAGIAEHHGHTKTGKIQVWDIRCHQPVRSLGESYGFLSSLVYTPDGKHLVSGENVTISREKLGKPYNYLEAHVVKLRVWDAETGSMLRELSTPQKEPGLGRLALSRDGNTLAAGYEDKILVWDLATSTVRRSINVPKWRGGRGLAVSPDGQVVCAPLDNTLGLWNTVTGQSLLAEVPSHNSYVSSVVYLTGGNAVVTTGGDTVRVWNAATGRQKWSRSFGGNAHVNALVASPDGTLIAAGGQVEQGETGVRIYQSATGEERHFIPMFRKKWYANGVLALSFTPDGQALAVVRGRPKQSNTYDLDLFNVETGKRLKEIACGFFAGVRPVAFTKDAASLYTIGHQDAVVNLWDVETGAPRQLFTAIKPSVQAPDGKRQKQKPFVADAAFAPDMKTLITSQGRELLIWDLASGEMIAALASEATEHGGNIALSNDGRWLAMTDENYAIDPGTDDIRVFDLKSRALIARIDPGLGRPSSFAFSPDGARLLTGMSDGTAIVWDLAAAASTEELPGLQHREK